VLTGIVDGQDVRVVQPAEKGHLLVKSPNPVGIAADVFSQDFDGDLSLTGGVPGTIDFRRTPAADESLEAIGAQPLSHQIQTNLL
jgi:hypothetical protein